MYEILPIILLQSANKVFPSCFLILTTAHRPNGSKFETLDLDKLVPLCKSSVSHNPNTILVSSNPTQPKLALEIEKEIVTDRERSRARWCEHSGDGARTPTLHVTS